MQIWRLIAHHSNPADAVETFPQASKIAIGWSQVGDLNAHRPANAPEIAVLIKKSIPGIKNAALGGPSLWRFYHEMMPGDHVIVSDGQRRHYVMEVTGPYRFTEGEVVGYGHWRSANKVPLDPEVLWRQCGRMPGKGESIRWTLCRLERTISS
jgi:predicted Mrr-cat superfamily restriction endonuclease